MDQDIVKICSEQLTIQDLPNEDLQLIAEDIGIEAIVKLALNHSGIYIYITKDFKKMLKRVYVLRTFDGSNAKFLARKLDISERAVYDWVNEFDNKRKLHGNNIQS